MSSVYRCELCGTPMQGRAHLCVSCYRQQLVRCPDCTTLTGRLGDTVSVRRTGGRPVDCVSCQNERVILRQWEVKYP